MTNAVVSPQITESQPLGTFARAIIVETSGHLGRRTMDYAASLAIHAAMVGALSVLPLFLLKQFHPYALTRSVFITATPLPLEDTRLRSTAGRSASRWDFAGIKLGAPLRRRRNAFLMPGDAVPPLDPISLGVAGGISDLPGGGLNILPSVLPVPPPSDRLRLIGGNLSGSRLIYGLSLDYPSVARAFHIFGRVVVEAVIDESGKVERVRALSGPLLLVKPALEAVSREEFEPTLLNGQPMPRSLLVEINFRLYNNN